MDNKQAQRYARKHKRGANQPGYELNRRGHSNRDWTAINILLVIENGTPEEKRAIANELADFRWQKLGN